MKNKRTTVVVVNIVFAVFYLGIFLGFIAISNYNTQKVYDTLTKVFEEVDQDMAIKELRELRGMILEVKALSSYDIPQNVLLEELESITSAKHFIDDFAFIVPNTSNVGEICDECISQIDKQIHTIEYGTKGE